MSARRKAKRAKCPRCGSKNVKFLNKKKEQLILECKRPSCNHKWHIPQGTNLKMALTPTDITYVENKEKISKEDKEMIHEIVSAPAEPIKESASPLEYGPDGSIRLKKS